MDSGRAIGVKSSSSWKIYCEEIFPPQCLSSLKFCNSQSWSSTSPIDFGWCHISRSWARMARLINWLLVPRKPHSRKSPHTPTYDGFRSDKWLRGWPGNIPRVCIFTVTLGYREDFSGRIEINPYSNVRWMGVGRHLRWGEDVMGHK